MIGRKKDYPVVRQAPFAPVGKPRYRLWYLSAGIAPGGPKRPIADLSKSNDNSGSFEELQFLPQEHPAVADFLRQGFVVGWRAAHSGCDDAVAQFESIARAKRLRPGCKPEFVKSFVQPVSTAVAREHAPCSIAAMGCWRESHHHEACVGNSECGERLAPVALVAKTANLLLCDTLAPCNEPRAPAAINDSSLQIAE
jgi:hypothetical protein